VFTASVIPALIVSAQRPEWTKYLAIGGAVGMMV
jgi:hypothetical protein